MRWQFVFVSLWLCSLVGLGTYLWSPMGFLFGPLAIVIGVGVADMLQKKHTIRRNFPVIGHGRYLLEKIRPEINQYFIESDTDGSPFSRQSRSLVYQRAKHEVDTLPFGTQLDIYEVGSEWLAHSLAPCSVPPEAPRLVIGAETCEKPYEASLLNISAMSFGALSKNAILALGKGAKEGRFAQNTGEGGLSSYHLETGADLIWQIGTGYFGCRTPEGTFDPRRFAAGAKNDQVKMIELKLSQGAKPAHGGILPASKLSREIAEIRGVPLGQDVVSPPCHREYQSPKEILSFVSTLRELSSRKPVGIKLCIGQRREFLALCKAMVQTGQHPDYIAVDGAEGGTGAAPLEFSNRLGLPLTDALIFAHNALTGMGLRGRVLLFASGKIVSGFDLARLFAMGADACYSARAMMMAVGCIQARRCNKNDCPTGVATQRPELVAGLDVKDKAERAARYHRETLKGLLELVAACGFSTPTELRPFHLQRRVSQTQVQHYAQIHHYLADGALVRGEIPDAWQAIFAHSSPDTFAPVGVRSHPPPSTLVRLP